MTKQSVALQQKGYVLYDRVKFDISLNTRVHAYFQFFCEADFDESEKQKPQSLSRYRMVSYIEYFNVEHVYIHV